MAFGGMNPAVRARWVAALRGGKYKQCKGMLRDHRNRCCCLGVLCDQIAPGEWKPFKLVVTIEATPAFLGGLGELEDHGQRGLV
jgi:hypothetical protein